LTLDPRWTETQTAALVKRELTLMGVSFQDVAAPGAPLTFTLNPKP